MDQWKERRYAEIPNSITREQFATLMDQLRDFCTLDNKIKNAIHIPGPNGRGAASYGHVVRTPDQDPIAEKLGEVPEHKEYIHYHPFIERTLQDQIAAAGPKAIHLIESLRELWITMEQRAYETLIRLEQENAHNPSYRGFVERFFPDGITAGDSHKRQPEIMIRLMRYKRVKGDNMLSANNHYDARELTFAVCESAPGLQVGSKEVKDAEGRVICSEHMEEVDRPDGTALFWPGFTFSNIDPEVEPTWHGVRQRIHASENVAIGDESRGVAVCFLDEFGGKIATIEQAHGVTAPKPNGQ